MFRKETKQRQSVEILCTDLVPKNHLLRKIDAAVQSQRNIKKHIKKVIPQTARHYEEHLLEEVNRD